jgi:hypothetical protein
MFKVMAVQHAVHLLREIGEDPACIYVSREALRRFEGEAQLIRTFVPLSSDGASLAGLPLRLEVWGYNRLFRVTILCKSGAKLTLER